MIPKHRTPTPLGRSWSRSSSGPSVSPRRPSLGTSGCRFVGSTRIVRGRRAVSPETAQLFAAALGTSREFCDRGDHCASHTDLLQEAYVSGLPPWRGMRLSGESGRSHGKATGA